MVIGVPQTPLKFGCWSSGVELPIELPIGPHWLRCWSSGVSSGTAQELAEAAYDGLGWVLGRPGWVLGRAGLVHLAWVGKHKPAPRAKCTAMD